MLPYATGQGCHAGEQHECCLTLPARDPFEQSRQVWRGNMNVALHYRPGTLSSRAATPGSNMNVALHYRQ
ncbi:MAG: hypothetical protein AB1846_08890, partial [Chloroflexota bacterium]